MAMAGFLNNILGSIAKPQTVTTAQAVGVDIGATSIKVVELESKNNAVTLTTYGELQLGPYLNQPLGQQVSLDAKKEQTALIDIFRESSVKADSGVFAVPLSSSFVTVMKLPVIKEEADIAARVPVEARKYIPVPINEVTLDWAVIGTNEAGTEQDVLLAAIQNDVLNRLQTLMKSTNMNNQPTEIECFSILRSVEQADDTRAAIIDLGGGSLKFYVSNGGMLESIHRIRVGGAVATQHIAEELSCTFAEAELHKRSVDESSDIGQQVIRSHKQTYRRALIEVRQVLEQYEKNNTKVDTVILSGGGAAFTGMQKYVGEMLGREVEINRPFNKVSTPAFMEDVVTEIGPSFAVALGAALRVFE